MPRYNLMPPNYQDTVFWTELCNAIDAVWKNEIDNPQIAFRLLKDTYALTYSGYGEPAVNSYPNDERDEAEGTRVFDINDFFNFSRPPEQADILITSDTDTVDITSSGDTALQTGYPQTLVIVYYLSGTDYIQIPPAQFSVVSPTILEFNYTLTAGTQLKIVERISSEELSAQLRYLGFQFPNTEFINRASSYVASPALQVLASNYSAYLAQSKGTRQFMDFYGFCLAAEFQLIQLWASRTKEETQVDYWDNPPPYLYFAEKDYATTLNSDTSTIPVPYAFNINGLPVPTADIDFYYKQPGGTSTYLPPYYYYTTDGTFLTVSLNSNFVNPETGSNTLADGTQVSVRYKRPRMGYGTMYAIGNPSIGSAVWEGGTWFPTSHVDLRYSLSKYGGSINFNEVRRFFKYIANLNLVLNEVVLYEIVTIPNVSVGIATQMKITQL